MSGETRREESAWETGTLKQHFDQRFVDQEKAVKTAMEAAQRATDKSESAQSKVNETQNEFRGALKDQAATLLPRSEYDTAHKALQQQVDDLKRTVFIGVGIAMALSFGVPIFIQFIK